MTLELIICYLSANIMELDFVNVENNKQEKMLENILEEHFHLLINELKDRTEDIFKSI